MRTNDERGGWRAPGCQVGPSRAVTQALAALDEALTALASVPLSTVPDGDVVRLLDGLTAITGRLTSTLGEVAVEADRRRLGDPAGARNTVTWWAHRTRLTRGEAGRVLALARDLEDDLHHPVAGRLREGRLLPDQAGVIVQAVEHLPADLGRDVAVRARDHLLRGRAHHDARQLRLLGRRILDVVAPEVAESHEQRLLEAEERRGGGPRAVHHGRRRARPVPRSVHVADAAGPPAPRAPPASPARRPPPHEPADRTPPGRPVITPERLGEALMDYVERYPTARLPRHGGNATTLTVTLDLDALLSGAGAATLTTGHRISAGEARRLACGAGLVPAVLGGRSEVLDLGRSRRFFTATQRRALEVRDGGCTAEGCGLPPSVCHAHHDDPGRGAAPPTRARTAALPTPPPARPRPGLRDAPVEGEPVWRGQSSRPSARSVAPPRPGVVMVGVAPLGGSPHPSAVQPPSRTSRARRWVAVKNRRERRGRAPRSGRPAPRGPARPAGQAPPRPPNPVTGQGGGAGTGQRASRSRVTVRVVALPPWRWSRAVG